MMKQYPGIRRLKEYDYSQSGAYFITICTYERVPVFGEIQKGEIKLNVAGEMIRKEWMLLPERFPGLLLDEFMVMPNHFHAIVWIEERGDGDQTVGAPLVGASNERRGDEPRAYDDGSVRAPLVGAFGERREDGDQSVGAPLVGSSRERRGDIPADAPRAKPRAYENNEDVSPLVGASGEKRGDKRLAYGDQSLLTSLSTIVGVYKSLTSNQYIKGVKLAGWLPFNKKLWQQNYYEHIIRNEFDLDQIREYIITNPIRWELDEENPSRKG